MVLKAISDPIINRISALVAQPQSPPTTLLETALPAGSIDLAGIGMSPHQFAQFSGHETKTVCQADLQTTKIAEFCCILVFLFLMLYIAFPFYS